MPNRDAPWLKVEAAGEGAAVTTPQGTFTFDFLIISTGLISDPALRPELRLVESHIARWSDRYRAPEETANPLLDAHPYLSPGFAFLSRDEEGRKRLHGLFAFNYSAPDQLRSFGLGAVGHEVRRTEAGIRRGGSAFPRRSGRDPEQFLGLRQRLNLWGSGRRRVKSRSLKPAYLKWRAL